VNLFRKTEVKPEQIGGEVCEFVSEDGRSGVFWFVPAVVDSHFCCQSLRVFAASCFLFLFAVSRFCPLDSRRSASSTDNCHSKDQGDTHVSGLSVADVIGVGWADSTFDNAKAWRPTVPFQALLSQRVRLVALACFVVARSQLASAS